MSQLAASCEASKNSQLSRIVALPLCGSWTPFPIQAASKRHEAAETKPAPNFCGISQITPPLHLGPLSFRSSVGCSKRP